MIEPKFKKDIRQRKFEAFEEIFWSEENAARRGPQQRAGVLIRAALGADWLDMPLTEEDVPEMYPKDARVLAEAIDTLYGELANVDPN